MHWKSFVVPWAYWTNVALARREENMYTLLPPPRMSGAFTEVRFTPRRTDYAFRGGRRDFEEYLGTAHTIGNRFDNNSTAPAALTPAADASEFVEETQKRTSAATSFQSTSGTLVVLLRHVLILIVFTRVIRRDGFLRDCLHETLRVLFVALYAHAWPPIREP
jgi:hypothetical protein